MDCGLLKDPTGGEVNLTGSRIGDMATYECYQGYDLSGLQTRICQKDGTWSGEAPTCECSCLASYLYKRHFITLSYLLLKKNKIMYTVTPSIKPPYKLLWAYGYSLGSFGHYSVYRGKGVCQEAMSILKYVRPLQRLWRKNPSWEATDGT